MKKILTILLILSLFVCVDSAHAGQVGFPETSLWYSNDDFVVGNTITIYTLVVNSESSQISGTVQFFDRDTLLGEKKVVINKNDTAVVSLQWKVSEGEHQFSAQFSQVTLSEGNGTKISIAPTSPQTKKDVVFVKKSVLQENSPEANTLAAQATLNKDIVVSEVSKATDFLKDKTPDSIESKVSSVTLNVENLRETWESQFTQKKQDEKDSLEVLNDYYDDRLKAKEEADPDNFVKQSYVDSSGENILKKPVHYVLIFLYSLIIFIVGNALVFYGLGLLVLFWIVRGVWRKIRN